MAADRPNSDVARPPFVAAASRPRRRGRRRPCCSPRRAFAQDQTLQSLIDRSQRNDFGQGYDNGIRTVRMPKSSLPTLAPQTLQTTEAAIPRFEAAVQQGGWAFVPPTDRLRLGNRHASVVGLRQRLIAGGDLATSAGASDVFDSYVEAAVKRFQARHGLTADGIVREATFAALNIPAEARLAQLKTNVVRLRSFSGNLGPKFVMCNIPAAQIEAIENGVAVTRHTAVVGKPDRPSPDIQSRIVEVNFNPFWTVPVSIVQARSDSEDAGGAGLPDQAAHPHHRSARQRIAAAAGQLEYRRSGQLQVQAGSRRFQFARCDPHQFPVVARRLHARHAVEESVRRGFPLPLLGLRARSECARTGDLAAARHARAGRVSRSTT